MADKTAELVRYIKSLLNDSSVVSSVPDPLLDVEGIQDIDQTVRNIRGSVKSIGNGDLSDQLNGRGYVMGTMKSLQATLRNLVWQTKAIAMGDFSHRVEFLGEFSDSFNSMVKKLQSTIDELNEAKSLFELFFETIPDATMIVSFDEWSLFDCNHAFETLVGLSKADLLSKSLQEISFFQNAEQEKLFEEYTKQSEKQKSFSLEIKSIYGEAYHGLLSSAIIHIENEKFILSVIKNITELKNLEKQLRDSEAIHRLLADNASDVIWTMDLSGAFTYVSPSVEKLRGYTPQEVMAQTKEELLCPLSLKHLEKGLEDATYSVQNHLPFQVYRADVEQPCKDGTTVWTDLTVSGIYNDKNQFLGMLGVSRDITERIKMEEEVRRLTEIDRLTQLYNRLKLDTVLFQEIERSKRSNSLFAIILLDIDDFKRVNDNHGHIAGDEVLKEIAEIIRASIRKIDTAGRWGGEEFVIVLPETDGEGAQGLAEKIRLKINAHPFQSAGYLTASFGVAAFEHHINETELVSRADHAMYEAKHAGKNRVCIFLG